MASIAQNPCTRQGPKSGQSQPRSRFAKKRPIPAEIKGYPKRIRFVEVPEPNLNNAALRLGVGPEGEPVGALLRLFKVIRAHHALGLKRGASRREVDFAFAKARLCYLDAQSARDLILCARREEGRS